MPRKPAPPASRSAAPAPSSDIGTILGAASLARLRALYNRDLVVKMLESDAPQRYGPAQLYFSAVTETFYRHPLQVPEEQREALDIKDRQRCILALQAAQGEPLTLAIHTYISLMEGIKVYEVANIFLLAGVYMGVPKFFVGLNTLGVVLKILAALVDAGQGAPPSVLAAFQGAFGSHRDAVSERGLAQFNIPLEPHERMLRSL